MNKAATAGHSGSRKNALAPASLSIAAGGGRLQIHGHTSSLMGGNKGNFRSTNFSSPEVALREPIEQDFSLNRRLAHQIYARDKMEGARERRDVMEEKRLDE